MDADKLDALRAYGERIMVTHNTSAVVDLVDEVRRLEGENTQLRTESDEHKAFVERMRGEFERIKGECADVSAENTQLRTALNEALDALAFTTQHSHSEAILKVCFAAREAARVALGEQ